MADAPKPNPHAERIAALAAEHAPDVVKTLVSVMNDPKSRQRVAAAMQLAELMLAASPAEGPARGVQRSKMTNEDAIEIWRTLQARKRQGAEE